MPEPTFRHQRIEVRTRPSVPRTKLITPGILHQLDPVQCNPFVSRSTSTFAIKVKKAFCSLLPGRFPMLHPKQNLLSILLVPLQRRISPNQTNSFSISRIRSQLAPPVLTSLFCCINLLITSAGEVEQNQASPDTGAAGNASSSCPSLSSRS